MLPDYEAHTVTLRQPGTPDFYGRSTPTDTQIRVFWEGRRALVRAPNGEMIVSEAKLYTTAAVAVDDEIVDSQGNVWPVIRVNEQTALDGTYSHMEVAL
jgi:hypothetical protein